MSPPPEPLIMPPFALPPEVVRASIRPVIHVPTPPLCRLVAAMGPTLKAVAERRRRYIGMIASLTSPSISLTPTTSPPVSS